jgi:predicted MPP superfamily phosphohydrolase
VHASIFVILALMFALDLAWWRYADGLCRPLRRARLWRGLLAAYMALQVFLLAWSVSARLVGPGFDQLTPKVLIAGTYIWHLVALPVLLLLWLATGIFTMPVRLAKWLRREHVQHPQHHVTASEAAAAAADLALEPETAISPSRRQLLGAALAATPPLLTAGTVAFSSVTLNHFHVRDLTIAIPNLPRDLDGLRIAHVTDIHVGRFTDGPQLRRIVEATNQLHADLVLMTGDLINSSLADLSGALDAVKRIDSRFGVYTIEGNHDLCDDAREFDRRVKAAGVPLLVNEAKTLNVRGVPLQLLGLRWGRGDGRVRGAGGDDALAQMMPQLLAQRQPDAFPILLAHHPHAFDWAAAADIPLTLSGHTHGGQLMLSCNVGFGPLMYRYWSGLYQRGSSQLLVANGVGNWFPLRVHAPAEIIDITLRRG